MRWRNRTGGGGSGGGFRVKLERNGWVEENLKTSKRRGKRKERKIKRGNLKKKEKERY